MDEVFPVMAGIALGLVMRRVHGRWLRAWLLLLFSLLVGAIASWISGELVVSAWYLLIDCAQVLVVAWMALILANAYESRSLGLRRSYD
jgi:hypothetical protein